MGRAQAGPALETVNVRLAAVTAVAGAIAIALLVATGLGRLGGGASAPGSVLAVRTALAPASALYGDEVTATVVVSGAPGSLDGVSVQPSFTPYAPTGPAAVTRTTAGHRQTLTVRYRLQCLTEGCLPVDGKPRQLTFPAVTVAQAKAAWPPLLVSSRLTPAELASSKLPVRTSFVPAPQYDVVPGTLAALLTAAAGLLALCAAVLAYLQLAALVRTRRERRPRLTGLALALAYARDAAARPDPADRRRAAELLAEALRPEAPELADAAGEVAWSDTPPTPEQTLDLVAAVEGRA